MNQIASRHKMWFNQRVFKKREMTRKAFKKQEDFATEQKGLTHDLQDKLKKKNNTVQEKSHM